MEAVEHDTAKAADIRFLLRSETRREHEALDSHPAFAAMTDGSLRLDHYRQIMLALHGVYRVLDPILLLACERFGVASLGFSYAPRGPILKADLDALAGPGPAATGTRNATSASPIASAAALGGMLYVVEGSVLGGAMLHRATRDLLGAGVRGNGYWSWCAEEGGGRWGMTCRLLSRLDGNARARLEMITSARTTFNAMTLSLAPLRQAMEAARC